MNQNSVLVVDDDVEIRKCLIEILHLEGFLTSEAHNGAMAMEVLNTHQKPVLIILDMLMPIMDGQEFLLNFKKQFSETYSKTQILVTSANALSTLKVPNDQNIKFLGKPFSYAELMDTVQSLIKSL